MFNIIIAIVSILLVGGVALATLYFGGDAFQEGNADAQAAQYMNEAQQLTGAVRVYRVDHRETPSALDDLTPHYLRGLPDLANTWQLEDGNAVRLASGDRSCEKVNERAGHGSQVFDCETPPEDGGMYCCVDSSSN